MLDNIIQKHDNKIHNNTQKNKIQENQHRRATRVPVLCNTARVAERVQKTHIFSFSLQGT